MSAWCNSSDPGVSMIVQLTNIGKSYTLGGEKINVLSGVDFMIHEGDFISIMGTSGSGKTTLLHIIGTLLEADSGSYRLDGKEVTALSDRERSWIRAHWIGYVFQTFDLIPEQTVMENVALPYLYRDMDSKLVEKQIKAAIDRVGLTGRMLHRPHELSGGEMQRVAIARALAVEPKLILADEPTGNLDQKNSEEILSLLKRLNEDGATIIMVTHDPYVATQADRKFTMQDGRLTS